MNRKLTAFANGLELFSAALMLLAALRANGGLPFWLPMALTAMTAGIWGLGLSWLCSEDGRNFRRRAFGTVPTPAAQSCTSTVIPFPKAG